MPRRYEELVARLRAKIGTKIAESHLSRDHQVVCDVDPPYGAEINIQAARAHTLNCAVVMLTVRSFMSSVSLWNRV